MKLKEKIEEILNGSRWPQNGEMFESGTKNFFPQFFHKLLTSFPQFS